MNERSSYIRSVDARYPRRLREHDYALYTQTPLTSHQRALTSVLWRVASFTFQSVWHEDERHTSSMDHGDAACMNRMTILNIMAAWGWDPCALGLGTRDFTLFIIKSRTAESSRNSYCFIF